MSNQQFITRDKTKMQDITVSEVADYQQFLTFWANQNVAGITDFISTHPDFKYKIFNAYNWNRLINLVNDNDPVNGNSLVSRWQKDFGSLQNASASFVDKGTWATSTGYETGNLVKGLTNPYISYICISDHTSSSESELSNTSLWLVAQENLAPNPIVVSATIPNNYKEGDMFLKTI